MPAVTSSADTNAAAANAAVSTAKGLFDPTFLGSIAAIAGVSYFTSGSMSDAVKTIAMPSLVFLGGDAVVPNVSKTWYGRGGSTYGATFLYDVKGVPDSIHPNPLTQSSPIMLAAAAAGGAVAGQYISNMSK